MGGVVRVLVCGSRTWADAQHTIWPWLNGLRLLHHDCRGIAGPDEFVVIEGGAKGADEVAAIWAHKAEAMHGASGFRHEPYPADWATHGKAAGFIRNQQMLDEGKPDLVLAFVDKPLAQSRGTADMVRRAKAAGIPVYVVEAS